ncbi:thyrotropin-releasing hormone receptor-like [Centruroides sculpturatus]|uniref:thyrotropin-releasing hormone receptor-like n=1 Tax=Centruroides sculpturatus TaxID=218467 RepID=UPI000C6CBEFF|nr:thyrotropin-releasing hormone receptor-like [Centruroides sculpturatus]
MNSHTRGIVCEDYNDTYVNQTDCANVNYSGAINDTGSEIAYLDPHYYSMNYRVVGTIFQSIIFVVGVLGNIMVVIVVMRTRTMRTPTNCYLVSLSIADFLVLISSVPNEILAYYLLGDEWIWGRAGCAIFIFSQYLGINVSSLSITAFTIERYIAICHPMKAQTVCTVKRAKKIIIIVWCFAFMYCSPWLFLTKTKPLYYKGHTNKETCDFAIRRKDYLTYFFADLVIFYIIPLVISCVLYGFIAKILFSNDIPKSSGKTNGVLNVSDSKKSSTVGNARVQVVKMLVVVVAVFATLWLPYRVLLVYNSLAKERYMELWYLMFSKTMVFINSAINPILYNAMSIKFRRAFKRMLSCSKKGTSEGPFSSSTRNTRSIVTNTTRITSCKIEQMQHVL